MCRNIKILFNFDPPATDDEMHAASVQFIRKISGSAKPAKVNEMAFERAVDDVAASVKKLLGELVTSATPKNRDVEKAKAQARAAQRFGATASAQLAR